ncbi:MULTISPECIES: DedA family protein [unclassified Curtobacterium]|uniref:DedA family protein n=1 Tax=unclassified Curtobacterium TaxID=257496 RepID=UPI001AE0F81F|nr:MULTISPECIES: VTT domain-containing protein [unclassified Curtobacterium]MBP1301582.1 membrane protein DedA with SNARE-associated domain [Curtobacterium sp. 1310]MCM3503743.1 VTT domain-containing protein [Curtobacterium sp. ODYSSEY 48 V2]MCM3521084.1 VTT domain-containing protein [Curtobacterium sp. P97]MDB6428279.1 VTT domain-containing protein [Curtobacterium sp. 20TX0008]MDT0210359.1 VTT domain-containing protein [Curtobacterium sp. BRD11]
MDAAQEMVLQLVGTPWAFLVVGLVLAAGSVAVFLPSQALVVAIGTLLVGGDGGFLPVLVLVVAATIGMVLGDVALWHLARTVDLGSRSWFSRPKVRKARESIDARYRKAPGRIAVLGRFIPMGRLTTNLVGADSGLDLRRFLVSCLVADVVWAAYCVGIAAATGHWSREQPFLVTTLAVVASILLGLAISAVEKAVRRRAEAAATA